MSRVYTSSTKGLKKAAAKKPGKRVLRIVYGGNDRSRQPEEPVERSGDEQAATALQAVTGGPKPVLRVRPAAKNGTPIGTYDDYGNWQQQYVVVSGEHEGTQGTKAELTELGQVHEVGGRYHSYSQSVDGKQ